MAEQDRADEEDRDPADGPASPGSPGSPGGKGRGKDLLRKRVLMDAAAGRRRLAGGHAGVEVRALLRISKGFTSLMDVAVYTGELVELKTEIEVGNMPQITGMWFQGALAVTLFPSLATLSLPSYIAHPSHSTALFFPSSISPSPPFSPLSLLLHLPLCASLSLSFPGTHGPLRVCRVRGARDAGRAAHQPRRPPL